MKISKSDWIRYREMMSKISRKAAEEFDARFQGKINTVERKEVIDYAMALVEKYSEASSELACQMYERIAELSGVDIPPAVPAETAEYGEVAKGINGTLKQSPEGKLCRDVVDRLVKRAGADTMLKNAERDRAQFAWVPHGDTCSFCIILASRGWQNISKKTLKNGHAEHIHAHCDCQYCVRFNQNTEVEGYDPDQYLDMYENAEGDKWRDKLNAMRRKKYKDDEGPFITMDGRGNEKQRDIIKPHNIIKNLQKTQTGKKALELIESKEYKVKLLYGVDNRNTDGKELLGYCDHNEKEIGIYTDKTSSVQKTAEVVVHEAYHLDDFGNCQKSEVYCIIKERQHNKKDDPLTKKEVDDIIKDVKYLYPNLPWEV